MGSSDIILKVTEAFPHHLGLGINNQGTRLVGKYRETVYLRSTNISSINDSLFINPLLSTYSLGESVSYILPLDTYGRKLGLDFTHFTLKLGKEFKGLDITGKTTYFNPYLIWELALSERFKAEATLGMEIKSIKKKTGLQITTNDQVRLPYLAFDFVETDSFLGGGQTSFEPRFTLSTKHLFGASERNHPSASRAGTGGFFFKYEQDLRRIQRMPLESYLLLRSRLQTASYTLPSSEQLQLGGAYSIRGYPEGDYLADWGGLLNLEWLFPSYWIPKSWKLVSQDKPLRNLIEPVVFLDIWRRKAQEGSCC